MSEHASERFADHFFTRMNLFIVRAAQGAREEAFRMFEAVAEPAQNDLQYSLMVGEGFALLGDAERAFNGSTTRSVEDFSPSSIWSIGTHSSKRSGLTNASAL